MAQQNIPDSSLYLTGSAKPELDRLLNIAFRAHGLDFQLQENFQSPIFWTADFFQIQGTTLWKSLSREEQNLILLKMNQHLLREAYYIENAGMLYSGKMNLMAESETERSFFCLMAHEEANHLELFRPFLPSKEDLVQVPTFSQFIGKIIAQGDRRSSLFLIQIILEGWGMTYYQSLLDFSQNQELKKVLKLILNDESRHHSAGVLLFESTSRSAADSFLTDAMMSLLGMLQVGPATLVHEILQIRGDLTPANVVKFLEEMNAQEDAQKKILKLRKLSERSLNSKDLEFFDKKGAWQAFSHSQMAKAHFSS